MKTSVLTFLTCALAVSATPVQASTILPRDTTAISNVIKQVSGIIDDLTASVKSYSGNTATLVASGNNLTSTLDAGVATISSCANLGLLESLTLGPSVALLSACTQNLVVQLNLTIPAFQNAGACSQLNTLLAHVNGSGNALLSTTSSKIPLGALPLALLLSGTLSQSLGTAATLFTPTNCVSSS